MVAYIVGIDCATQPENVGLALAQIENNRCEIVEAKAGSNKDDPLDIVLEWHRKNPLSLLALDAPLGWPLALGSALVSHQAGETLEPQADNLFHRLTDSEIKRRLKKRPIEVGANLIARTAKAALDLLTKLRHTSGESIPLAWKTGLPAQLSVIEVYPAATHLSLLNPASKPIPSEVKETDLRKEKGETKAKEIADRLQVLEEFANLKDDNRQIVIPPSIRGEAAKSPHVFDAILCAVAAYEFIEGRCVAPADNQQATAEKEGWIWVGEQPSWITD